MRFFLIALFAGLVAACASGSAVRLGDVRPPLPVEAVQLYAEMPPGAVLVGMVKASSDTGWTEQAQMDRAIIELREQAAGLGANGVIVTATGTKDGEFNLWTGYSSASKQVIEGRAVYVAPR